MNEVSYKTILKKKNYMLLLFANIINRIGDSVDTIAFSWLVYAFTGEGTWAALVFAVNKIPSVVILPMAGAYVEKKIKKKVMILCDIIRAVLVTVLLASIVTGKLSLAMLLSFSFLISLAEAFRVPAGISFITQLLDKEELSYGIPLNVIASTLAEVAGAAVAGIIISWTSVKVAFGIDIATFVISLILIVLIHYQEQVKDFLKEENSFVIFRKGLRYIKEEKILLYVVLFAMFANAVMAPIDSLQTVVVVEIFQQDAAYLSVLNICLTVGMLLASALYPVVRNKIKTKPLFVFCCGYIAALYLVTAALGHFSIAIIGIWYYGLIICYLCYGLSAGFVATGLGLMLMEHTQQEYMARINTIYSALGEAIVPVASAVTGMIVSFLPIPILFLIVAAGIVVLLLIVMPIASRNLHKK